MNKVIVQTTSISVKYPPGAYNFLRTVFFFSIVNICIDHLYLIFLTM